MSRAPASSTARGAAVALATFAVCALGVSQLEPRLASELHIIKDTDDIYPFPPPPILRLATLGYVAATTDTLWAKLLIEHGAHWGEHRPFGDLEHYLDAIVTLEPTFRPFYEYVDTLLCYRPMNGHEPDAKRAREYLERGTRELPTDAEIWLHYGQFVAFMGPSYLSSPEEQQAWRKEGALAIERAVSLGADVDRAIAASSLLRNRMGEDEAAAKFLERAYALTDDEAQRAEIAARLELMHQGRAIDCRRKTVHAVEARWRLDYLFLDRGTFSLVGPTPSAVHCVGAAASLEPACARDWDRALPKCDEP
jgi:tetratricopeptide (TPR) repeat protein